MGAEQAAMRTRNAMIAKALGFMLKRYALRFLRLAKIMEIMQNYNIFSSPFFVYLRNQS
jgi:hypothetical protein